MKKTLLWPSVCSLLLVMLTSCVSPPRTLPEVPSEVISKPFVYEVVRHLYRWYLDEIDVARMPRDQAFVVWVRELRPPLDAGDQSRFSELVFPALDVVVVVKKAHYTIEEVGLTVRNEGFKIVRVSRESRPAKSSVAYRVLDLDYTSMRDDLFRTRFDAAFPEGELLERMRTAVLHQLRSDMKEEGRKLPQGKRVVHLAPLSPVANETWVYGETARLLVRFSSDIDLADPAVWEHEELSVDVYDVDEQVVVSLDEVAGSNAYMTRDQVGRALFNCVVLGRKMELEP
jgi:hypothetical protein